MANHNYLPHNGIATASQFQQATETVFGMAPDLGGFLGNYGALIDGDGTSWSTGEMEHFFPPHTFANFCQRWPTSHRYPRLSR
jgi:hypothetical protein